MSSEIEVRGLRELQAALQSLPDKIAANILRGALRAGAKPIAEQAKNTVHKRSGALAASIRIGTKVRGTRASSSVKAAGKGAKGRRAVYHAHLLEYGTRAHIIEAKPPHKALAIGVAKVHHPGARPFPFMRPAMDAKAPEALKAAADYIRKRLLTQHGIDVPEPPQEGDE